MLHNNNTIKLDLIKYLCDGNPQLNSKDLPTDKSLVEMGYLDSFGIVDTIVYLENKYKIKIQDEEINKENIGSIDKMVDLILNKLNK